jgi:polyisoprenoid-binding protein YceI
MLAVVALARTVSAGPTVLKLQPDDSHVRYEIDHTLGPVKNTAGPAEGSIETAGAADSMTIRGHVNVDLREIRTGVDQRDHHIKSPEYLDVERFPLAEFSLTEVVRDTRAPADSLPPGAWRARARGTLQLHGQTRDVEVPVVLVLEAKKLRVRGGWTLALADYGIKRPKKLMFSAGKTVDVKLDLVFAP